MHRKFLWTLGAALLMASMMSVPAWAETAVVTGSDVNLREGPGTNYRILDCLPWGSSVTVTDQSDDTWYAVEVDGQTGFMSAQYLEIQGEEPQVELTQQPQHLYQPQHLQQAQQPKLTQLISRVSGSLWRAAGCAAMTMESAVLPWK